MPNYKYEAESGDIHLLRLDAARGAVAGAQPADAVSSNIRAQVSKGNTEYGLRPRGVRLARTIGVAPDTAVKYAFLPVLTVAAYATAAFALGATISYGGNDWEVVAKVPEDY